MDVGSPVEAGTLVALVEVMKQFFDVPAGVAGTIATVEVPDAEMVDAGPGAVHRQPMSPRPLKRVLVANRGEIAMRVIRAAEELGLDTVAVYSEADRDAGHVRLATEAVEIGPPPASRSYLDADAIIGAALAAGCDAIHPGYGFLSENAAFAARCAAVGLRFVGPRPEAISLMGDKAAARETAASVGVPVVPGTAGAIGSAQEATEAAATIGFPLLVKASAGGGGARDPYRGTVGRSGRLYHCRSERGPGGLRRRRPVSRALHPQRPPRRGAGVRRR